MNGKVYFIGAGPGEAELITVKGQRIINQADLILYAGSLVPKELFATTTVPCLDSATMTLSETHAIVSQCAQKGGIVARVHTGDPTLFGALREQIALLNEDGIAWEVIPGVTAACAAAARGGISFSLPEVSQSLILTRVAGRTPMPETESIESLATHGCSMAIYLAGKLVPQLVAALRKAGRPEHNPILCAHRVGFKDEVVVMTTLAELEHIVSTASLERQTVFLVLPPHLNEQHNSRLYASDFSHTYRNADCTKKERSQR